MEEMKRGYVLSAARATEPASTRRQGSIMTTGKSKSHISCTDDSLAGAVSQRACVFCGARVVLNPVTDAIHLVHGPIGCATYTWDIRGSLSSGSEMYRNSFSTDLKERDVIFGGEKKLAACIDEVVAEVPSAGRLRLLDLRRRDDRRRHRRRLQGGLAAASASM